MQLDEGLLAHAVPERQLATTTTPAAKWVTVTVPDSQPKTGATGFPIAQRATTTDTGLGREHAGGVIIGVSIGGLILLILLAWCCSCNRRRYRFSDTSSSSASTSRPSYSPPAKPEHVKTPAYVSPSGPSHVFLRPVAPPMIEKPAPAAAKPARREPHPVIQSGIADRAFDEATNKITVKKGGKEFVVGGSKEKPGRPIAWKRPRRPRNLNIPRDQINTF